jgi:sulfite exporter TauE/SafE
MGELSQRIAEAGFTVYLVFALALVALAVAVVAIGVSFGGQPRNTALAIGGGALLLGIGVPVTGVVGYAWQMARAFDAVASVDPSMRATLLAQGISEAMNNIVFGAICGVLPCLLALAALVRAMFTPAASKAREA